MYPKLPPDHPHRKHSANFSATKKGLTQAQRLHKDAIRRGDAAAIDFSARIHMFIVGIAAEARLRKILSEPEGFNERERQFIASRKSQLDQWKATVEYAFRRHHSIPIHLEIDKAGLPQYGVLIDLLGIDLASVIQDRNKTAHAEWVWHLNSKGNSFTGRAPSPLNYIAIQCQSDILDLIAELVHILVVSEPTFQRDYEETYNKIISKRAGLSGSDYPRFAAELRKRARRS